MQTWLDIDEFSKLVGLEVDKIKEMIDEGELNSKEEKNKTLIEVDNSTYSLIPSLQGEIIEQKSDLTQGSIDFAQKTIATIISLQEKVLDAKDETIDTLKGENHFLKEALFSMQELYDEDRKTIETLTTQLKQLQEELEFTRRKYKLMWNQAVENYKKEN